MRRIESERIMDYQEWNMMLMEAFGDLERLCNQIYGCKHGVTVYIEEMEQRGINGAGIVPGWIQSYKRLKDIRHKRNKLSHGEVSFFQRWAEEEDVRFAEFFREQIMNGTDPLATYRRNMEQRQRENVAEKHRTQCQNVAPMQEKHTSGCWPVAMTVLAVLGFLIFSVVILMTV